MGDAPPKLINAAPGIMDRLFAPDVDPSPRLRQWPTDAQGWHQTPFGVAFQAGIGDLWSFRYDAGLPGVHPRRAGAEMHGVMSGADVDGALTALQAEPDRLRTRPAAVATLEALTGRTARLKDNYFGGWYLCVDGEYSLFNNPFRVSLGYTDSTDNFEVWFKRTEDEPRGYVPLNELCAELRRRGYAGPARTEAPPLKGQCAVCGAAAAHRCSRCHARPYCSRGCQAKDWPTHRTECRS